MSPDGLLVKVRSISLYSFVFVPKRVFLDKLPSSSEKAFVTMFVIYYIFTTSISSFVLCTKLLNLVSILLSYFTTHGGLTSGIIKMICTFNEPLGSYAS